MNSTPIIPATPPAKRQKALVLIHHNDRGPYIEVYADESTDVRIEHAPTVWTANGEATAEAVVRQRLPWCYRDLLDTRPRAHDVIREVRPSQLVDAHQYRQLLRGLDRVARQPQRRRAC